LSACQNSGGADGMPIEPTAVARSGSTGRSALTRSAASGSSSQAGAGASRNRQLGQGWAIRAAHRTVL
jgi:hypothetical protein